MYIKLREKKAFTLVEIMIVVAIIGLLVAIALPNFIKARTTARTGLCENNLRLLGHGAEQYIIDNNLDADAVVDLAEAQAYIKGEAAACPGGGAYGDPLGVGPTVTCTGGGHVHLGVVANPTYDVETGLITWAAV